MAVWRWQERFMTDGVAGLLRDKTRPSRIPPLEADVAARVVSATRPIRRARQRTGPQPPWPSAKASAVPFADIISTSVTLTEYLSRAA
jgi:hypothetical protein